jgi:2'-5' RNA ligase
MQHRYFIGLNLPETLSKQITQIQQTLFDATLAHIPLKPHITLLPPPAVERIEPEELARQAAITSEPFWPLNLTLSRVTMFKDTAIAIEVESEQLHELQKQLRALLPPEVKVTYYPEPEFSPHVTLLQAKQGKSLSPELAQRFTEQLTSLLPTTFETTHLTLYRWIAHRKYEAVPLAVA